MNRVILYLIACITALFLGFKTLVDPDLGWHLAGGLWMLDHHTFVEQDPFGMYRALWIAYSWLPELLFADLYHLGGFRYLQLAQFLSVLAFSIFAANSLLKLVQVKFAEQDHPFYTFLCPALGFFVFVLFTSPVWHLRPQLFSAILFLIAIYLGETNRLSFLRILILTIFWANVHVYWVFMPVVVFAYRGIEPLFTKRVREGFEGIILSLVSFLSALVNPYLYKLYTVPFLYAFFHEGATGLIKEFQPLSSQHGYLFYSYLAVVLILVCSLRSLLREERLALLLLWLLSAIGTFLQFKYVPLFGITSAILVSRTVLPVCLHGRLARNLAASTASPRFSPLTAGSLGIVLAILFSALYFYSPAAPTLSPKYAELLTLAPRLITDPTPARKHATVLNHFDDGGYLALGLYLARKQAGPTQEVRTSIDGRTLVMGDHLLREFEQLRKGEAGWCGIIEKWGADYAVLPNGKKITKLLEGAVGQSSADDCARNWKVIQETKWWALLKRTS